MDQESKPQTEGEKGSFITATRRFIQDVMAELHKCSWPNRAELIETTLLVIGVVAVSTLFIFGCDQVFNFIFSHILKIV